MALDLGDLDELLDGGMYAIVGGKKRRIPPVSGELGLWGRRAAVLGSKLGDDATPEDLKRIAEEIGDPPIPEGLTPDQAMLSPELHAELIADGVDDEMIKHLAGIVYARIVGGDKMALAFAHGDDPKAMNRAERRAAKKATPRTVSSSRTTSTAAAGTTRKAASGNATKSPRKSAASAKGSRGRKS